MECEAAFSTMFITNFSVLSNFGGTFAESRINENEYGGVVINLFVLVHCPFNGNYSHWFFSLVF